MAKVCDKTCKGCLYYFGAFEVNNCCNYLLVEGKRRMCDPGKDCTKRASKKRTRRKRVWIDWQ